ncbi:hypothetical protein [Algibacter pacificus]|uniref:hypothetical protein n=1 Tax=Algibacter pacificus TaxID=2599389 RepID=UPI0011C91DD6|nr:hypothetical protein [Algibacter pacificus]
MFFNAPLIIDNDANMDLTSLVSLSTANAESGGSGGYEGAMSHPATTVDVTVMKDGEECTYTCSVSAWTSCVGKGKVSCTGTDPEYDCDDSCD